MNKKIKTLWVKALRSGKYHQGRGALKTRRGNYCCLGVLTDLYCINKGIEFDEIGKGEGVLPWPVVRWAGLHDTIPMIRTARKETDLATINDHGHHDFKSISTIIQAQL